MKIHLYAHNNRNLVKVGDKVEQYKTPVGTIGTANGAYYAHLHFSISKDLTPSQLKAYVNGLTKDQVKQSYIDPKDIDFKKMMPNMPINVGVNGYNWLDSYGKGFHPGVDVNGDGGGNTDLDWEFRSSCNGKVILSEDWGKGWGKVVLVEEIEESSCEKDLKAERDYSAGLLNELKSSVEENRKLKEKLEDIKKIYER